MMIYLMLSAIALSFGLLGFLLHAFYFSKSRIVGNLTRELDQLGRILREKETKVQAAREEIAGYHIEIRLIERLLAERNKELNLLHSKALRLEEELRGLRRISGDTHFSIVPLDSLRELRPTPSAGVNEEKNQDSHLWRKKLNAILHILDAIEQEMNRK
jgi:hypothetical protein